MAFFDIGRDAAKCRKLDHEQKWLAQARSDTDDPSPTSACIFLPRRSTSQGNMDGDYLTDCRVGPRATWKRKAEPTAGGGLLAKCRGRYRTLVI